MMFERLLFGEDYYENAKNDEVLNQVLVAAKNNNYPVDGSIGGECAHLPERLHGA